MKKFFVFLAAVGIFISCSTVQVSSDFDRDANFKSYKTYSYAPEASQLPVDDINKKRIMDAVDSELAAKGFTKADQSDVWIDLKLKAQQKQTATATNNGYGAGYGYRWGGGFSTTTINVENYTEGTLFVDMIDASKKQLVWQGRAVGTLDPNASAEKREQNINSAVKQIFTKYPPAGK
ncbi:MAG TPA: DUF4136 domain-containing protein [Chryseolinea sp.]|nr:DUF4136 domain-containing protein [Chryseolinea sp.]